ncbi:hypothetical protein BDV32DRAFT_147283 [Aspergillus pseudonomiae]|uniref:Uncharacterized protein n=1 Tax=Aspergillus pseudonomiae TaxID=1506151 RepID=A0A5N6I7T5_9EURO|nr:uncharacterized protein BDV37DRAFT_277995 [Aspergillus pseudonomiae]KAB8262735.1 hypothetical protein BDV32DRAFT_147283 [Aspergillus pseudonomiae]KAE8409655.1 hypothetical protein BDV37DRAFT_277995 [Aspergillus pseudonomiae]
MGWTSCFRKPSPNQTKSPPPENLINITGIPKDVLYEELLKVLKPIIMKDRETEEFLNRHPILLRFIIDKPLNYAVKKYIKPQVYLDPSGLGKHCDANIIIETVQKLRDKYPLNPTA